MTIPNAETTNTNTPTNGAANPVGAALAQLAQAKGLTMPSSSEGEGAPDEGAQPVAEGAAKPVGEKPAPAPAQTQQPAEDVKAWADKYVAKDAAFQSERKNRKTAETRAAEVEKQYNDLVEALRNDPVAVGRKHGARFGDIAAAKLLEGKDGTKPASAGDEMPAWAKELQTEVKSLREHRDELLKERDQFRTEQRQKARTQGIADMLKDNGDYTMLNELGKHDIVLRLVEQHYGEDSELPDERELQETILKYSREVERQLRDDLGGLVKRPSIQALVAKELGKAPGAPAPAPRKEAKPARPEIEGEEDEGDGAPVITNDLAQQRLSNNTRPAVWDKDAALRKAAAEMQSIFQRGKTTRED